MGQGAVLCSWSSTLSIIKGRIAKLGFASALASSLKGRITPRIKNPNKKILIFQCL